MRGRECMGATLIYIRAQRATGWTSCPASPALSSPEARPRGDDKQQGRFVSRRGACLHRAARRSRAARLPPASLQRARSSAHLQGCRWAPCRVTKLPAAVQRSSRALIPVATPRAAPCSLRAFAGRPCSHGYHEGAEDAAVLQDLPGQVPPEARGQDGLPRAQGSHDAGQGVHHAVGCSERETRWFGCALRAQQAYQL